MTSSARTRIDSGTVRQSALAVLRLMTRLEPGRPLDRQIGRFRAFQDLVDEYRRPTRIICRAGEITHQPALPDKERMLRDGRQTILKSELGGMLARQRPLYDQTIDLLGGDLWESSLKLGGCGDDKLFDRDPPGFSGRSELSEKRISVRTGFGQRGEPLCSGHRLDQEFDLLSGRVESERA